MNAVVSISADEINEAHRLARSSATNAIQYAIRCGELLQAQKAQLSHGQFIPWVQENCDFSYETAKRYSMAFRESQKGNALPISSLRGLFPSGRPAEPQHQREPEPLPANGLTIDDLAAMAGHAFGCITADPPWQYGNQGTRASQGNHYSGMSIDDICALPVEATAAENAHLHLWTTNAFLFEARRVMEAWGFEYKSCFVWVKPQMGIGNYWRVSHEFLLLGVRGSLSFADKGLKSWLEEPRGQHSAKPERVYDLIERASPGPYLEMFARRRSRPGWSFWGNQIEREVFAA